MLLLVAFLLIGSVRALREECPIVCYHIRLYANGQSTDLDNYCPGPGDMSSESESQVTETCDENVRCRFTVMLAELTLRSEDGEYVETTEVQYTDRGCGETGDRCKMMKQNLDKVVENKYKDMKGLKYSLTLKSCEDYS